MKASVFTELCREDGNGFLSENKVPESDLYFCQLISDFAELACIQYAYACSIVWPGAWRMEVPVEPFCRFNLILYLIEDVLFFHKILLKIHVGMEIFRISAA